MDIKQESDQVMDPPHHHHHQMSLSRGSSQPITMETFNLEISNLGIHIEALKMSHKQLEEARHQHRQNHDYQKTCELQAQQDKILRDIQLLENALRISKWLHEARLGTLEFQKSEKRITAAVTADITTPKPTSVKTENKNKNKAIAPPPVNSCTLSKGIKTENRDNPPAPSHGRRVQTTPNFEIFKNQRFCRRDHRHEWDISGTVRIKLFQRQEGTVSSSTSVCTCGEVLQSPQLLQIHIREGNSRGSDNEKLKCHCCGENRNKMLPLPGKNRVKKEIKKGLMHPHPRLPLNGPSPYTCMKCSETFTLSVQLTFHKALFRH